MHASYKKTLAALSIAGLLLGPAAVFAAADGPTVTLASTAPDPTGDNPIMFTVSISADVTDFDAGDISVQNGSIVNFSGSGSSYTFGVKPGDGDPNHDNDERLVEVQIHDNRFSNNQPSNYLSRWYDPEAPKTPSSIPAPTLTIDSGPAEGSTATTSLVTFEFSASEGATTRCTFGTTFDCSSPMTLGPLGDSAYTLTIVATNSDGSASTTVTRNFTVTVATSSATSTPSGDTATTTATTTPQESTTATSGSSGGGGGGGGSNGQVVGSGPSAPAAPGTLQSGYYNPNPIIPTVPTAPLVAVVPADASEASPAPPGRRWNARRCFRACASPTT